MNEDCINMLSLDLIFDYDEFLDIKSNDIYFDEFFYMDKFHYIKFKPLKITI